MKHIISFLIIIHFCESASSQKKYSHFADSVVQKIDSIRKVYDIPELGFSIITENEFETLEVLGWHQKNGTEKASIKDRFHLGSNTKAITGFIAARLVEKQKINWDSKLSDILPEWNGNVLPDYKNITLANLLSHKAHIQAFTDDNEFAQLPAFNKGTASENRKQFAKYVLTLKPVIDSISSYDYSNAGYSIASVMLEKISGKTWEQLVVDEMKQLGINAGFSFPAKKYKNQPWGHDSSLRPLPPNDKYIVPDLIAPAGDLNLTLGDYAKFIRENLKGLKAKSKLLTKKTFEYLHFGIPDYAIGWGWGINKEKQKVSTHSGSGGTFYCQTYIVLESNTAFVIVANAATEQTEKGIMLVNRYLRSIYKP